MHRKVIRWTFDLDLTSRQCSLAFHEPYLELVNALLPVVPKGLDTFFFWNSGAEAVEQSIKIARAVTGRQNIITMQGQHTYVYVYHLNGLLQELTMVVPMEQWP